MVWTLVVTGMDGIVFWAPILIHTISDPDGVSGAGELLWHMCLGVLVHIT